MAKKKDIVTDYCGYRINQKVDVLYFKNGNSYWVKGYTVFDPNREIDTAKGLTTRVLKKHTIARLNDHVPICSGDGNGKAIVIHQDRIRAHKKGDSVSFEYVFGSCIQGGIILEGVKIENDKDDLTLGLEFNQTEVDD